MTLVCIDIGLNTDDYPAGLIIVPKLTQETFSVGSISSLRVWAQLRTCRADTGDAHGAIGEGVIRLTTGKSPNRLSSPSRKNIPIPFTPKSPLYRARSDPMEGRIAIVTNAGRNAMDVAVSLTNDA